MVLRLAPWRGTDARGKPTVTLRPHRTSLSAIASPASCRYSRTDGDRAASRRWPPALETGAAIRRIPRGDSPGDSSLSAGLRPAAQVVPAGPRVGQERGPRRPAHHVSTALGALAISDSDHIGEVGRDLHTATVHGACSRLPPGCLRQVDHLHSSCSARYFR